MRHTIKIIVHLPAAFTSLSTTDARELMASFQSEHEGQYVTAKSKLTLKWSHARRIMRCSAPLVSHASFYLATIAQSITIQLRLHDNNNAKVGAGAREKSLSHDSVQSHTLLTLGVQCPRITVVVCVCVCVCVSGSIFPNSNESARKTYRLPQSCNCFI